MEPIEENVLALMQNDFIAGVKVQEPVPMPLRIWRFLGATMDQRRGSVDDARKNPLRPDECYPIRHGDFMEF